MTKIMLTPERASLFSAAKGPVVLIDSTGRRLGEAKPEVVFSAERIAEAKRRIQTETQGITTAELLEKLRKLEAT